MLVIGGQPKSYKSFIMNTIAYHLVTGTHLFNSHRVLAGGTVERMFCVPKPKRVLLFEQEVGSYGMKNRMMPMVNAITDPVHKDAMLDNLVIRSRDTELLLDSDAGMKRIGGIIEQVKPEVVIFDPFVEFHASEENSTMAMNNVLRNISRLRDYFGTETIFSHHCSKPSEEKRREGADLLRGNSVIFGKGDAYLMLTVGNRSAGVIRVNFTLRQDRPIQDIELFLDWTELRAKFKNFIGKKNANSEPAFVS
jgi:RecA-family ATPase